MPTVSQVESKGELRFKGCERASGSQGGSEGRTDYAKTDLKVWNPEPDRLNSAGRLRRVNPRIMNSETRPR